MLFRPQPWWQEVLPQHVAPPGLQYRLDVGAGGKAATFVRAPPPAGTDWEGVAADPASNFAVDRSVCVPDADTDDAEQSVVAEELRAAASWDDPARLRRLFASCHCTPAACEPAVCEAAAQGHEASLSELLRAGAPAGAWEAGRTALHAAVAAGQSGSARLLLARCAPADAAAVDAKGRSCAEIARAADLGRLAREIQEKAEGR